LVSRISIRVASATSTAISQGFAIGPSVATGALV
jgi:hypothetical protein